jgi:hypothetical protein
MSKDPITASAWALAGGAISTSLIQKLLYRGILSADDAKDVLLLAQSQVTFLIDKDAVAAAALIGEIFDRIPE